MTEWVVLVQTVFYLTAVWVAGYVAKLILFPPIVMEIIVGIILGPHVADIVPFASDNGDSLYVVLGMIGITLLVMHSGLHVSESKIYDLGYKGFLVGIFGTVIPIITGLFTFRLLGLEWYPGSFAAVAITPASVGVAMRILIAEDKLNTRYGQAILLAANIDDLLTIMAFVIIQNISKNEPGFVQLGLPIIGAVVFIIVSLLITKYIPPKVIKKLKKMDYNKLEKRDTYQITIMIVSLMLFGTIWHYIGTILLGAFLIGLIFSKIPRSHLFVEL